FPAQRELAETNAAQPKLAERPSAAAAPLTAVIAAHLELRLPLDLLHPRPFRHRRSLLSDRDRGFAPEGHPQLAQQRLRGVVPPGGRHERDIHAMDLLDLVVLDLREEHLLLDPHRVIPPAVEAVRRQPAEIAHARHRDRDEPVEELVHPRAAERHAAPDRHPLTQVEVRDRLLGPRHHGLLAGDGRQLPHGAAAGSAALACFGSCSLVSAIAYFAFTRGIGWPDLTAIRSAVPSLSRRRRTRVGSPDLGSSSITFDAASGAGSSMMPLSSFGVAARLCFFTMFTPSTTTRNSLGCTRSTFPSFPRCSPEITRTVSPLAMCSLWRSGSRGPVLRRLFLKTSGFMSDHLGRERHDLHEPLLAQLPPHGSEDAGRAGLALVRDEHGGVLVEPDVGAVLALGLLGRPHDHRLHHLALLDLAGGNRVLDRDHDDVAQPRVAPLGPAEHAND